MNRLAWRRKRHKKRWRTVITMRLRKSVSGSRKKGKFKMRFELLLMQAKAGNHAAIVEIFEMYRPLLIRKSIVNGSFDEDLYQELAGVLLLCIQRFQVLE